VHVRRALLLFALVLGLAAIATSVSRPTDQDDGSGPPPASETEQTPTVSPGSAADPVAELTFEAGRDRARRLEAGRAATVLVEVDEPGEVDIAGLGLNQPATPLTPARFDVLASDGARHPISFTPADEDEPETVGTLVIAPER
jgi:hypothetical protein